MNCERDKQDARTGTTRSSENFELLTSNRRPSHQSRFSRESRPARLSQVSATHMLVLPHRSGRLGA